MPQFDMPSVEEHFVASGRQVLSLVGVAALEPGDILGPNTANVSALMKMAMPKNLKQVRALMSGVGYYRKFLPDLSKRIHLLTDLLQMGV